MILRRVTSGADGREGVYGETVGVQLPVRTGKLPGNGEHICGRRHRIVPAMLDQDLRLDFRFRDVFGGTEQAVERGYAKDIHAVARHVEYAEATEAETDGGRLRGVNALLRPGSSDAGGEAF